MFYEGKKHGNGWLQNKEGKAIYIGEYFNELKHGKGKEFYNDGSIYDGQYQNGKKNGYGKLKIVLIKNKRKIYFKITF